MFKTILHTLKLEAALLPRKLSSHFLISYQKTLYSVSVRTFVIPFYFRSGSRTGSGMHSESGSGSAKERNSRSDRIRIQNPSMGTEQSPKVPYSIVHVTCFCTIPDMLNNLVDESDPDLDLPNIVHAYQTAERIRFLDISWDGIHERKIEFSGQRKTRVFCQKAVHEFHLCWVKRTLESPRIFLRPKIRSLSQNLWSQAIL